jgi:uncharacterized protein DUF5767
LELLENKKKLKPGVPIFPKVVPVKVTTKAAAPPVPKVKVVFDTKSEPTAPPVKNEEVTVPTLEEHVPKQDKKKKKKVKKPAHEDELLEAIGEPTDEAEPEDTFDDVELAEPLVEPESIIEDEAEPEEDATAEPDEVEEAQDEEAEVPADSRSPEEVEAEERKEYMWRFKILKKKYPQKTTEIPEFTEFSDLGQMKVKYEEVLRELSLDDNIGTYRYYLIAGIIAMEYIGTQHIGIDLSGFTRSQLLQMTKYDRLLIELGERGYNSWSSNIPVEIRILVFIFVQAGIFWLGKILSDKCGPGLATMIFGYLGSANTQATAEATTVDEEKPRKMKGPSVKLE